MAFIMASRRNHVCNLMIFNSERATDIHTDRQTAVGRTDERTDGQAGRQADRHAKIHIYLRKSTYKVVHIYI